jgi:hypothetical protein
MSGQSVRALRLTFAALLTASALPSLAIASAVAQAGEEGGVGKVRVRISGTNDRLDVTDGTVAGIGHFTASGAITDKGKVTGYRTLKGALITLRFVSVGKRGTITFVTKIDTILAKARWTIASGTRAYKGLHGRGTEHENADYTVSMLTGTVWR